MNSIVRLLPMLPGSPCQHCHTLTECDICDKQWAARTGILKAHSLHGILDLGSIQARKKASQCLSI
jgi:hypothetical protein